MKSVSTINQTDQAKKKLAAIAKNNGLAYTLVSYLFSFHWNYDGPQGGTWVYARDLLNDATYHSRYDYLLHTLNLPEKALRRDEITHALYYKLRHTNETAVRQQFLAGAATRSYPRVSEFASYWYLRNATIDKLATLPWQENDCTPQQLTDNLFFKLFRGGSIERYNLEYLYADLVVALPYQPLPAPVADWLSPFINSVTADMVKPTLPDLRTRLKPYCRGDRHFRQTVLEALSYAGYLPVENHPVANLFIPDYRGKSSAHASRNEWTYPLRFW